MKNYITGILSPRIYQRDLQNFNLDDMFKIKKGVYHEIYI